MNKRSVAYAFVLLVGLIAVSVVLNRGLVRGVERNTDIELVTDASTYVNAATVEFTGTLNFFTTTEEVFIHRVTLIVEGSQDLEVTLPLEQITSTISLPGGGIDTVTGVVQVTDVTFSNVGYSGTLPGGTLSGGTMPAGGLPANTCPGPDQPSGTLPGDTLPSSTLAGGTLVDGFLPGRTLPGTTLHGVGQFGAIDLSSRLSFSIDWSPAVCLPAGCRTAGRVRGRCWLGARLRASFRRIGSRRAAFPSTQRSGK